MLLFHMHHKLMSRCARQCFNADNPSFIVSSVSFRFSCVAHRCCAGTQAELQVLAINPSTKFSDMFETAEVGGDGKCPAGFSPANPPSSYYKTNVQGRSVLLQCLKIKVTASLKVHSTVRPVLIRWLLSSCEIVSDATNICHNVIWGIFAQHLRRGCGWGPLLLVAGCEHHFLSVKSAAHSKQPATMPRPQLLRRC
jgi:hypothetical protein